MKTLYLHIGMPKTGTSYLQSYLSHNNALLNMMGYDYPDFKVRFPKIGLKRNGHFLIYLAKDEAGRRDREKEKEIEEKCFSKLFECFEVYDYIILSDEGIWNFQEKKKQTDFWEDLKERLFKRGISLKVIVYLRRQDLYIQSAWAQFIKETSMTMTMQDFLKSRSFKGKNLDYYKRLREISDAAGKENMIVRIYEKEQYMGTQLTIISDFLNAIGLTLDARFEDVETKNRSFLGIYLEVKRELNKVAGSIERKGYIYTLMNKVLSEDEDMKTVSAGEFLSYEETLEFLKQYEKTNQMVAQEYLGRKEGNLFRQKVENFHSSPKTYELSDYVKVFAKMLFKQRDEIKVLQEENRELREQVRRLSVSISNRVVNKIKRMFKK